MASTRRNRFKRIAGGRSARWAFMEKRLVVPNYDGDGNYLTRWRLFSTPWGGLYLHRMDGPDPRTTLHDHPWRFLSLVLRGGYVERRLDPVTMNVNERHRVRRFNRMGLHDAHAIVRLLKVPTWTLLLVGPRRRTWGYLEPETSINSQRTVRRWAWTEFDKHPHAAEFDAAVARRKLEAV